MLIDTLLRDEGFLEAVVFFGNQYSLPRSGVLTQHSVWGSRLFADENQGLFSFLGIGLSCQ